MKVIGKGQGSVQESLEQLKQRKQDSSGAAKTGGGNHAKQAAAQMDIHQGVAQLLEEDEAEAATRAARVKHLAAMYKKHGTIEYDSKEVAEKLLADIGELGFISQALTEGE